MRVRLPIQLMWPTTFDPAYKIPRKLKETSDRRTQDPATIAWNLLTATYYKAGGLPWRLARDARQLRTSFVGLSFYRSVDGDHVHTSTAQMFDERGEGLILRGGRMIESEEDRKPHLTAEDAFDLLRNSLRVFRDQHGHWPARVVLHKTSKFDRNELDGFHKAIDERDIDYADFVWVQKSMTRLYRFGAYPPLRGSLLRFDKDEALLYTRGSVEFFRTYPGMYIPRPLMLHCQAARPAAAARCRGDFGPDQNELEQYPVRQRSADHHCRSAPRRRSAEIRWRGAGNRATLQLLHVGNRSYMGSQRRLLPEATMRRPARRPEAGHRMVRKGRKRTFRVHSVKAAIRPVPTKIE